MFSTYQVIDFFSSPKYSIIHLLPLRPLCHIEATMVPPVAPVVDSLLALRMKELLCLSVENFTESFSSALLFSLFMCLCVLFFLCVGSSTDFEPLCGRPHALRLDRHGQLIVADSYLGLHSVDPKTGRKTLLVANSQGEARLSNSNTQWGQKRQTWTKSWANTDTH